MRWLVVLTLLLLTPAVLQPALATSPDQTRLLVAVDELPLDQDDRRALEALGVRVVEAFPMTGTLLVDAPEGLAPAISALGFVEHVGPDEPMEPLLASSRTAAGLSKSLYDAGLDGTGVTIALVDSGIDQDHPALRDNVVADIAVSEDGNREDAPTSSEHGTHVAGVLVGTGQGSPDQRLHGVAPGARLVSLDLSSQFTTSNALRAFEWIYNNHEEHDIRVVANSWGRQRDQATYDAQDPLIRAADALVAQGIVVVFSAGNGGDVPGRMTLEATNPNVITVGAVSDDGRVESYSSRGPVQDGDERADWYKPDLVAPGTRVVSTRDGARSGNLYQMMNGTSMAAPHVAGAAALMLSVRPDLSPAQVKGILTESARDVAAPGPDDQSGYGMLDVHAAVLLLEQSESRVIEHRSQVAEKRGQLAGPGEASDALQLASMQSRETVPLQVRENATSLQVHVAWSGDGDLQASLEGPGDRVEQAKISHEHSFQITDPAPGAWRLVLSSQGLDSGTYETEAYVVWAEARAGTGLPVDALVRPSSGGFPSVGVPGPFGPSPIPGVPMFVTWLAGGVLTVVMMAGGAAWKRRD